MFREPLDGINGIAACSVGANGKKCAARVEATELFQWVLLEIWNMPFALEFLYCRYKRPLCI